MRPLVVFAAASLAAMLVACATPEELAARKATLGRDTQTGTRIQRDDSASRTDSISDQKAVDDTLKDLRNLPAQTASPQGSGR